MSTLNYGQYSYSTRTCHYPAPAIIPHLPLSRYFIFTLENELEILVSL